MERSQTYWTVVCSLLLCLAACSSERTTDDPSTVTADTVAHAHDSAGAVVDTTVFAVTDSTITLRQSEFPKPGGRVVNVMVTGVDSRLGDYGAHADANHLVRFFLDSGMVEIISIPRDTPSDAGFDDTTGLNRLTNVRANRGRHQYLAAVSEITGVSPIHHWVEFGFSQAVGLLELLGYKSNAMSTLHVLRSRQAYRAGDYQRSYNQGRFIRSALLKNIQSGTDLVNGLMLRAGIMMVETDMSYGDGATIIDELNAHGFDGSEARIWVRLEPPVLQKVQAFEFDSSNIAALDHQISGRVEHLLKDSSRITSARYERQLDALLSKTDSSKKSAYVVRILKRPYDQRAWLQITDSAKRDRYRDRLCTKLEQAYRMIGNTKQADMVKAYVEQEKQALAK